MSLDREVAEHDRIDDDVEDEALLWSHCRAGDINAREQLVRRHLPHARRVAGAYYSRRRHDEIDFDDYHQLAILGMMESIDRYDPSVGVRFQTFAGRRMHGVILDGLERMSEKQQQIAARRRAHKERMDSLIASRPRELAEIRPTARGSTAETEALFRYLAEVGVGLALSLMLDGTGMLRSSGEEDDACPIADTAYYRRSELRMLREKLLAQLDGLRPQARQVIRSHYVQAMSFEAIAEAMNLTKGRVSQIHREALQWLRTELKVERSSDLLC